MQRKGTKSWNVILLLHWIVTRIKNQTKIYDLRHYYLDNFLFDLCIVSLRWISLRLMRLFNGLNLLFSCLFHYPSHWKILQNILYWTSWRLKLYPLNLWSVRCSEQKKASWIMNSKAWISSELLFLSSVLFIFDHSISLVKTVWWWKRFRSSSPSSIIIEYFFVP